MWPGRFVVRLGRGSPQLAGEFVESDLQVAASQGALAGESVD